MLTLKKNYASLESKADNLYELTEEDIKRMHEVLLEMYDDLFEVCEKNSIKMLASGGTALGTIRHQGFIPWDDDMDLHFSRSDYETFIKIFEKEQDAEADKKGCYHTQLLLSPALCPLHQ